MSLTVSIDESLEKFVREKVTSGEYSFDSDVVNEALRLLQRRDEQWRAEVAAKIEAGVASIRSGRVVSGDEGWAILRAQCESAR